MSINQARQSVLKRITLLAIGSRGDVQPLLVAALALRKEGHEVRLLAGSNFESWLRAFDLDIVPATVDMVELMQSQGGEEWVRKGNNPIRQLTLMKRIVSEYGMQLANDMLTACEGADVVISSAVSDVIAASIVEKLGCRQISIVMQPAPAATRDGRSTMNAPLPGRSSGINYLFGKYLVMPFWWRLFSGLVNDYRVRELKLDRIRHKDYLRQRDGMLVLQAFSPSLVPLAVDLPPTIHTIGFLHLPGDTRYQPPADLLEFLKAGKKPVFVGFGSMTGGDQSEITQLLIEASEMCGVRMVLQSGWASLGQTALPDHMHLVGDVPHDWLFEHMAAAVHHGGAGTTGASLRAGLPTVVVPHLADQLYWGRVVAQQRLGPDPVPRQKLTARRLAEAMDRALGDKQIATNCKLMAEAIANEDGTAEMLKVIGGFLNPV